MNKQSISRRIHLLLKTEDCKDSVAPALLSLVTPEIVVMPTSMGRMAVGLASEQLSVWRVNITWLWDQHKIAIHMWCGVVWCGMAWRGVAYHLTSFHIISHGYDVIWYMMSYRDMIWDEMILHGIVSYHIITRIIPHGYDLSWVLVVLGTSCSGYELSWVRIILGTNHTGALQPTSSIITDAKSVNSILDNFAG